MHLQDASRIAQRWSMSGDTWTVQIGFDSSGASEASTVGLLVGAAAAAAEDAAAAPC